MYVFDKEVVESKAKSLLSNSRDAKSAKQIIENVILPCTGSEGDYAFWLEVKSEVDNLDCKKSISIY